MDNTRSIECPSCRKANAPSTDLGNCLRCGCDLGALGRIDALATHHLDRALESLVTGDWESASDHAIQSWDLRHTKAAARVGFLANAAQGELEQAGAWLCSMAG